MSHLTRVTLIAPGHNAKGHSIVGFPKSLFMWSAFDKRVDAWVQNVQKQGHVVVRYGWKQGWSGAWGVCPFPLIYTTYEFGFVDRGIAMLFKLTFA